ncbi:MAG: hypothetical protein A3D24_01830 [Candidatus Blackburnbacteria bacterium RIFCSPHIGHO2_02_FULL_39_13]|nr:MAG: hypothetical protein UT38_C0020G0004 [Microgenomates group bacterium GW2011_GWA2_39_19]OGY06859.1 MAG: hypothetical protein A2694_00880 [Candidatus Blackburnbacteria bacterium RIFCSPHIGHO2_01_FULL_40_17]OGY07960.1 MAG: hypothetical protein A3D24_01830 [Candidatus Blackburnbacteria bacterium RIFCSPHIGHO2_02_FULL_39_13]
MEFKQIFIKEIIILFFTSRMFFLLFAALATLVLGLKESYLGKQFDHTSPYFSWIWANFDGRHYLNIAVLGYRNFDFAFFPLYPSIISLLGYVFPIPHLYLGIGVSFASYFVAMIMIYKIVKIDYKNSIAKSTLLFLSFFPLAFFYNSVYPDSIFLLLTTLSFYCARKKRWVLAGIVGGLSVFTRISGLSLLPALAVEWYIQNNGSQTNFKKIVLKFSNSLLITLSLTLLGLVAYMVYLRINFGDWFLFQKSMSAWNQQGIIFPPQVVYRYLKIFFLVDKSLLVYWVAVLEFTSFVFYILLSMYVLRKVRFSYGVFSIILLLMVTFTGTFAGTPRYMLHLFPGFIAMALIFEKRTLLRRITIIVFFVLGAILTGLFTRGYFVT